MGKLSKADVKLQQQVQTILKKDNLSIDDLEYIYEHYDPGYDISVTEKGVYFTPIGMAQDFALMAPKSGLNIVDICGGIGMLSYKLICMSYYHQPIKSITIIEYNNHFVKMGNRLLSSLSGYNDYVKYHSAEPIQINYVNGSMFDIKTFGPT